MPPCPCQLSCATTLLLLSIWHTALLHASKHRTATRNISQQVDSDTLLSPTSILQFERKRVRHDQQTFFPRTTSSTDRTSTLLSTSTTHNDHFDGEHNVRNNDISIDISGASASVISKVPTVESHLARPTRVATTSPDLWVQKGRSHGFRWQCG